MPPASRVTRKSADASPRVIPARFALIGLVTPSAIAWSAPKPPAVSPQSESVAPAITASQTPRASSERAEARARAPEEQAVESV